ncbi:MAG: TonB-dependent receptor, partial [Cytophagales bacterium]|nr:TonB-dependent receptor [Cytophagales bacterium]
LYANRVQNVVNRVNTVDSDSVLNRIYSNVGTAQSLGLELGLELHPATWWKVFVGGNVYDYRIRGSFDNRPINTSTWVYSVNANTTFQLGKAWSLQGTLNYISQRVTAQGVDSRFLAPNLTLRKGWMDNRLVATLQWLYLDMGLLPSNEQRITTWRRGEFYTTTNYVYEVDMVMLNLSYQFNQLKSNPRFIKSEFGEREF